MRLTTLTSRRVAISLPWVLMGVGRRGGEETEGHPRIIRIAGKSQTIHTWSDRASNYFVSGEEDIKPGSIFCDTPIIC
jgi:hypothetical protein